MPGGLFYFNSLKWSISNRGHVWLNSIITMVCEIPLFKANSADPDQTPHFADSDQGPHCLQISLSGTQGVNGLKRDLKKRCRKMYRLYRKKLTKLFIFLYIHLYIFVQNVRIYYAEK